MKLIMSRDGELKPQTEFDKKKIDSLKSGEILNCTKDTGRSNPQIAMLWTVGKVVVDNMSGFEIGKPVEVLMDLTKIQLGHCHTFKINGKIVKTPRSISFSKMSQPDFNKFCNNAYELWAGMMQCKVSDLVEQGRNNA